MHFQTSCKRISSCYESKVKKIKEQRCYLCVFWWSEAVKSILMIKSLEKREPQPEAVWEMAACRIWPLNVLKAATKYICLKTGILWQLSWSQNLSNHCSVEQPLPGWPFAWCLFMCQSATEQIKFACKYFEGGNGIFASNSVLTRVRVLQLYEHHWGSEMVLHPLMLPDKTLGNVIFIQWRAIQVWQCTTGEKSSACCMKG